MTDPFNTQESSLSDWLRFSLQKPSLILHMHLISLYDYIWYMADSARMPRCVVVWSWWTNWWKSEAELMLGFYQMKGWKFADWGSISLFTPVWQKCMYVRSFTGMCKHCSKFLWSLIFPRSNWWPLFRTEHLNILSGSTTDYKNRLPNIESIRSRCTYLSAPILDSSDFKTILILASAITTDWEQVLKNLFSNH